MPVPERLKSTSRAYELAVTLWAHVLFWVLTLAVGSWVPVWFLVGLLVDHDRRHTLRINQLWCKLFREAIPLWRTEYRGLEKADPEQSYVIASNHLSALDILIVAGVDVPFRWVAKHSVYLIPIFGQYFFMQGHLVIMRGSAWSRKRFMRRARRTLDSGLSILIFPEGTRSRDGAMRPFKPGAFRLARDTGRPILPVIISGTWDIMPPGKLGLAGRAWAIVEVQDPEYVVADTPEELQAEMQRIREKMIRRKAELDEETSMKLEKWERRLVRK